MLYVYVVWYVKIYCLDKIVETYCYILDEIVENILSRYSYTVLSHTL